MNQEKQDLRTQLKQKPGKAALLTLLMIGSLWSWAGIAFGGDDQGAGPGASPPPPQAAPAPVPGAPASAPPAAAALNSFQAAMDRLAGWGEALEPDGLVPEGPVSVPSLLADDPFDTEAGFPGPAEEADEFPVLTGTVLFGTRCFAVFGGLHVQEGGRIGRYVVAAVRSREVDLEDGDQILTLKIHQPELSSRPDSLSKEP